MLIACVAAGANRTAVFRVTNDGSLEHRWIDAARTPQWCPWQRAPFDGDAAGVAAISGWDEQIEVFVLDRGGCVWNRWWWVDRGWIPSDGFNRLGTPFPGRPTRGLSALSAGSGHFDVMVEAADGSVRSVTTYPRHRRPILAALQGSRRACRRLVASLRGFW